MPIRAKPGNPYCSVSYTMNRMCQHDYSGPDEEPLDRGLPLREQVHAKLIQLLTSGRYPPGSALSEASLSRNLGVSRTPIREALLRLENEGMVRSELARGFTVQKLSESEVDELYPVLGALESLAVKLAAPMEPTTFDKLCETSRKLAESEDPVARWKLDSEWHDTLVGGCGNSMLTGLLRQLRTNLSRYELTYMISGPTRAHADTQHAQILADLQADNVDDAVTLLQQHWADGQDAVRKAMNTDSEA